MDTKSQETDSFSDQYKHPKWQKKRLEILERDEFTCLDCGSKDNPLHVHHTHYKKNTDVWDYDNDDLLTLCDECHKMLQSTIDSYKLMLGKIQSRILLDGDFFEFNNLIFLFNLVEGFEKGDPLNRAYHAITDAYHSQKMILGWANGVNK